ncbi:patatin-like phospholipase family protein [Nocardioides sp.]|uniref:patatin-like phospholipase family protein n=1 Tax=Nocardioides sp. TaxID=35761 RepID=UPI00286E7BAE|nr:patatin-like phospholipase family protein [Nocardioides sp.]
MTTAFVLSGGANLGAAQVGMLTAVAEAGVRPDLVVGTSVGALNRAWVAAGAPLEDLGAVWRSYGARQCSPRVRSSDSSDSSTSPGAPII